MHLVGVGVIHRNNDLTMNRMKPLDGPVTSIRDWGTLQLGVEVADMPEASRLSKYGLLLADFLLQIPGVRRVTKRQRSIGPLPS